MDLDAETKCSEQLRQQLETQVGMNARSVCTYSPVALHDMVQCPIL